MTINTVRLAFIISVLGLAGCVAEEAKVESITVMTINVQNLFDNNDDPNKDDKA
jgi:hypothetical protein